MQKIAILTRVCRLTAASLLFVFVAHGAGVRRATYECLDCTKNMDKNLCINLSFIIHVNFDHAWAQHYPVTISIIMKKLKFCKTLNSMFIRRNKLIQGRL